MLEIQLFGGPQIKLNKRLVTGFISSKVPALLIYLAVTKRAHQREALADLLWGESSKSAAQNNLRQALSNLRKLVEPHLIISRDVVLFNASAPYTLDVEQFVTLSSPSIADVRPERIEGLEQAVALYKGDFLAGFPLRNAPVFEEWLLVRQAHYRELALRAWHTLTEYYLANRKYGRAIDAATQALNQDPWQEKGHRQLMTALVRSGRRAAALSQYETCRRILDQELGVAPSDETTTLYDRIKAVRNAPTHNLPASFTLFVGRTEELVRLETWLGDRDGRLLTIIGPGGTGKTSLALQALQAHTADFLEGVWFVSLAQTAAETPLAATVANAINFQFTAASKVDDQLIDYLRGKEMLLALDNMEHLLNGRNLSLIASLLSNAPGVKLLVTSRERLSLRAETLLDLHGLPYPGSDSGDSYVEKKRQQAPKANLPADSRLQITNYPAGQLFVERAKQVQVNFQVAGQEAALWRLCQLVDGLPLALDMAASWARALTVSEIVAEIERGLDFLTVALHDLPERHRSLQVVFDHSWHLLTVQDQKVYARLSVFRGNFTAAAARAVAGANLSLLARLVDKSLLYSEGARYRHHPLLIQFAADKLAADSTLIDMVKQEHALYYGRFMRELEPVLLGGRLADALDRVRPELDNLRLAWQTAVENRDVSIINDLADSFMQIFDLFGLYQEIQLMAIKAIHALEGFVDPTQKQDGLALGRAYGLSSAFHFRLGKFGRALKHARKSLHLIAPFQPHIAYGHSLIYAGASAYGMEDFERSVDYWQKGLGAYKAVGSVWGECVVQSNLAEIMLALDEAEAAHQYATAAHALAQKMDNTELMAVTSQILAVAALREEDFERAASYGERAVTFHQQVGHQAHIANALAILARIAAAQENMASALDYLNQSVRILRQLGNPRYLNLRLTELAETAIRAGERDMAESVLLETLEREKSANNESIRQNALQLLKTLRQE